MPLKPCCPLQTHTHARFMSTSMPSIPHLTHSARIFLCIFFFFFLNPLMNYVKDLGATKCCGAPVMLTDFLYPLAGAFQHSARAPLYFPSSYNFACCLAESINPVLISALPPFHGYTFPISPSLPPLRTNNSRGLFSMYMKRGGGKNESTPSQGPSM